MKCFNCGGGEYDYGDDDLHAKCGECGDTLSIAALREIEAMQAVIAKLPVTADGVPSVPGVDPTYRRYHQGFGEFAIEKFIESTRHLIEAGYSTREAAEAAEPTNCTGPQPCGHRECPKCKGADNAS